MSADDISVNPSSGQDLGPSGDANNRRLPYDASYFSQHVPSGLTAGRLDATGLGGPWDLAVEGMLAGSGSPAGPLSNWSLDGITSNDPSFPRTGFETSAVANEPICTNGKGMADPIEPSGSKGDLKACPRPGCHFRAKTKRDVTRHHIAVHDKAALFFCEHQGCPREKGWSRKDLRDRHARTAHGQKGKPPLPLATTGMDIMPSPWSGSADRQPSEPAAPGGGDLERSLSREEALLQLYEERLMRMEVESQLQALRKTYEERDCMLLKILAGKVGLKPGAT